MYNNYQQPIGTMYQTRQNKPVLTNPLSAEKQKSMMQKSDNFSLVVTQEELDKAICTHKDTEKQEFALIPNEDGSVTCKICGETFYPSDVTRDEVKEAAEKIINNLQTIKMLGVSIPPEVIQQYMSMIPYLKRATGMYDLAIDSYNKFVGNNNGINNQYQGGVNPFAMLGSIIGNGYGAPAQSYYQQPAYMGQPMYQQPVAPQPQVNYGVQQPMMNAPIPGTQAANPFYATPTAQFGMQQMTQQVPATSNEIPVPQTSQVAQQNAQQPQPQDGNVQEQATFTV